MKKKQGFVFKKKFGQNFLDDPVLLDRIADVCLWSGQDAVLEIGPGAGGLTVPLSKRAQSVVAVEIDRQLEPILARALADTTGVTVRFGDALKMDLDRLMLDVAGATTYKLVANLPYYITTPLVMHTLEDARGVNEAAVMVQSEVADRMTAAPGSKAYGAVTVMVQYRARAERAFSVSRRAFHPQPNVDSAVLHLVPYTEKPFQAKDEDLLRSVVRAAFSQRRKTLANALTALEGREAAAAALAAAGIEAARRAETLSVEEFVRLADAYWTARQ